MTKGAPLRVFVGYDSSEPLAYAVLAQSILTHASLPVSITPLALPTLRSCFQRPRTSNESTEFAISRFLVPYLCDYEGFGLFMDCDMLCQVDLADVVDAVNRKPGKAVYCCQHDYTPKPGAKFGGHIQAAYPRKNWSSFMVFDAAQCRALTPAYVATATGLELHRFLWVPDDAIGELPLDFNWLVGEYPSNPDASVLHFTLGGPWHRDYPTVDASGLRWLAAYDQLQANAIERRSWT